MIVIYVSTSSTVRIISFTITLLKEKKCQKRKKKVCNNNNDNDNHNHNNYKASCFQAKYNSKILWDIPAQFGSENDPGFSWKDPSKIPAEFHLLEVRHTENSAAENL